MFQVILRKRYDHSDKDKNILYLYRLLAIKYRVHFPLKGESFKVDEDLRVVLETKICNAAMSYASLTSFFNMEEVFEEPQHKKPAVQASKKSTSLGKKPAAKASGYYKPDPHAYKKGYDYASSAHRSISQYVPHQHDRLGAVAGIEDPQRTSTFTQTPSVTHPRTFGAQGEDYRLEEPRSTIQILRPQERVSSVFERTAEPLIERVTEQDDFNRNEME